MEVSKLNNIGNDNSIRHEKENNNFYSDYFKKLIYRNNLSDSYFCLIIEHRLPVDYKHWIILLLSVMFLGIVKCLSK